VEAHVSGLPVLPPGAGPVASYPNRIVVLRDEEIPQRIGFVSDKIFEPSRWPAVVGGLARIGGPGVRLGRHVVRGP